MKATWWDTLLACKSVQVMNTRCLPRVYKPCPYTVYERTSESIENRKLPPRCRCTTTSTSWTFSTMCLGWANSLLRSSEQQKLYFLKARTILGKSCADQCCGKKCLSVNITVQHLWSPKDAPFRKTPEWTALLLKYPWANRQNFADAPHIQNNLFGTCRTWTSHEARDQPVLCYPIRREPQSMS